MILKHVKQRFAIAPVCEDQGLKNAGGLQVKKTLEIFKDVGYSSIISRGLIS